MGRARLSVEPRSAALNVKEITDAPTDSIDQLRPSASFNRILIASVVGILLLTLCPFRFALNGHLYGPVTPFFLDGWEKMPEHSTPF